MIIKCMRQSSPVLLKLTSGAQKIGFVRYYAAGDKLVKVGEEHDIVPIGPKFDSHPPPERPPCMSDRQEEEVSAMRHATFVRVAMCNERVYMVE
jgi:hypothetical protein